jgi:hypothetical protein
MSCMRMREILWHLEPPLVTSRSHGDSDYSDDQQPHCCSSPESVLYGRESMSPIGSVSTPGMRPLCINQERVLLSREIAIRGGVKPPHDLLSIGITFTGRLNERALDAALIELVRRHAGLRATFVLNAALTLEDREAQLRAFARTNMFVPGVYTQVDSSPAPVMTHRVDLQSVGLKEKQPEIGRLLQAEHELPFAHRDSPRLRAMLVRISKEDHLLIVVIDHLVADAFSLDIVYREIKSLYMRYSTGGPAPQQLPAVSYPDHAEWERRVIDEEGFARERAYWAQQWSQFGEHRVGFQHLPFSVPSQKSPTAQFGVLHTLMRDTVSSQVRSFAARHRVTVYMLIVAAYVLVLQRYTGKTMLAVWAHCANRSRREVRDAVGYFVNRHLLGVDVRDDPLVLDLLVRIRMAVVDALAHDRMPIQCLWHSMRCHPRFPDAGLLIDYVASPTFTDDSSSDSIRIRRAVLPYVPMWRASAFGIYLIDRCERLTLVARYSLARSPVESAQLFLDDLSTALVQLTSDPYKRISKLCGPSTASSHSRWPDGMDEFVSIGFPCG